MIIEYGVENVVYVDECGVNQHLFREYARAKRGVKIHATKSGKRFKRVNVIGAKWGKRHIAVRCYRHTTTSEFFEDWFEFKLIPLLPCGTVIVMDNARFHRKETLIKIAEHYGIAILFLPPYSPDYNLIENSWANLKTWLKDNIVDYTYPEWAIYDYFNGVPILF